MYIKKKFKALFEILAHRDIFEGNYQEIYRFQQNFHKD
jgi:hypothetical protein